MSKIVPKDQAGECTPWEAPDVAGSAAETLQNVESRSAHIVTADKLEQLQNAAFQEAYELGRQQGLDAGKAEIESRLQLLDRLMAGLGRPFDDLDDEVDRDLLKLAFVMAQQLVRRELKLDPNQIVGVVREAMSVLPVASRDVVLHLHPEDAVLVREVLSPSDTHRSWRISDDPLLSRGSCRVSTATSQVDARLETRLGAIMAAVLNDERSAEELTDES